MYAGNNSLRDMLRATTYRVFLSGLLFLCVFQLRVRGQAISTEQVFPVEGYSVFERGYPLRVTPGARGQFVFLEYWAEGKQGRRLANYYLQAYGIRDYVEHWFKPVTMEGFEKMRVGGVIKLSQSFAVWGTQNIPGEKYAHRVARFFALDGKPQTEEPIKLSTYTRNPGKKFQQRMISSPNGKYFLWIGSNGPGQFMHMYDGAGKERWEKLVEFPYIKDGYQINEIFITNVGEVMTLLTPEVGVGKGETGKPSILLRYTAEPEALETLVLYQPGDADLLGTAATLDENGDLLVMSALSRQGVMGIRTGTEGGTDEGYMWSHLDFKRIGVPEGNKGPWEIKIDSLAAVPQKWIARYQEKGGNFSQARILTEKGLAIFLFEETYATRKKQYNYDLACLAYETKSGKRSWSRLIEKKQRDSPGSAFLSYTAGIARDRLRIVYLSERGARGNLMCTSIEMRTGKPKTKLLASNEAAKYLFYPGRSGMVSNYEMVLISRGNPSLNDFKLITIAF